MLSKVAYTGQKRETESSFGVLRGFLHLLHIYYHFHSPHPHPAVAPESPLRNLGVGGGVIRILCGNRSPGL